MFKCIKRRFYNAMCKMYAFKARNTNEIAYGYIIKASKYKTKFKEYIEKLKNI